MLNTSKQVRRSGGTQTVVSTDGTRLAYEIHGSGAPAILLVHGWSCDRSYWEEQVAPLSAKFQVVAVDLAGHGESGSGRAAWTIEAFGADVAAVVDELALESVILVGHSMAGDVIVEAARRLRGRVKGLVWVDTYRQLANFPSSEQVEQRLVPFRADFVQTTRAFVRGMFAPDADESLTERVVADMSAAPSDVAIAAAKSVWNFWPKLTAALRELRLPIVAINPDHPPTDIESMRRYGVEVVLMPRVGHFLHMEDPSRFNELLLNAIDRLRR